jgi:acetamidase/formamidase
MSREHALPLGELLFDLDAARPPRLTVEPGDVVEVETEDAFAGQIRRPGDRRDRVAMPRSNPATGPIAVAGALPGDELRVDVLDIEPSIDQCCTYVWPYDYTTALLGADVDHQTRICQIRDGRIEWSDDVVLPYQPLIGVIGVAPAEGSVTTEAAGDHGGNLDLRELAPGSTVRLPVRVPGALLAIGDCHAAQGDGELSAAALEMPARVRLRIDLVPGAAAEGIRIETADELLAVAVASALDDAVGLAYARLARWLEAEHNWNRWEAWALLTQVGRVSLGYFREGIAAAAISRAIAERRLAAPD